MPAAARALWRVLVCTAALAIAGPVVHEAAAQDTHLLVISGVPGSPEHTKKFYEYGSKIVASAKTHGLADANIIWLGDAPPGAAATGGRATKETVTKAFDALASRVKADDEIFIILIGHGAYDGKQASFNLTGPDLSAADYATLLDRFKDQQVVFINTASSSGAFVPVLAGPGRTIVAATKTGGERNETRFPEYFVQALDDPATDSDRDGRVSVAEAFEYARLHVASSYEQGGYIPTEHPVLDDGSEGRVAAMLSLSPRRSKSTAMTSASPELRALVEEQEKLQSQVEALRLRKDSMDPAAYEAELERVLTDLALKSRAIRELEAKQ